MNPKSLARSVARWFAAGTGLAIASYAAYAGVAWVRYGKPKQTTEKSDSLLDLFMPEYEVVDRHQTRVAAPADVALSAATEIELRSSIVVSGIFKSRELILRSKPERTIRPNGLVAEVKALGWGVLAELPGREIVMGAITKPWEANPTFRALPSDVFRAFQEPGYVKIVWNLRADPARNGESVLRTETRATATDPFARKKFRRYWSFLSPGIRMIRRFMLPAARKEAERRCRRLQRTDAPDPLLDFDSE